MTKATKAKDVHARENGLLESLLRHKNAAAEFEELLKFWIGA